MRKLLFLVIPVCLLAQQAVLNDQRIMMLAQSGVSEAELLRLIATAPKIDFDLRPVSMDAMMKTGVSENVIKAMAARESGGPSPIPPANERTKGARRPDITTVPIRKGNGARIDSRPPLALVGPAPITSLSAVRRIYIEPLPNDFDQYLRAEFFKQMPKRVSIVLQKDDADAIITGVDEHDRRIASTITGRYLGLHDNTTASISVLDQSETVVLWSNEAGDRSLTFPIMHRNGERKVASRIVGKLKKAMPAK